jgi:hypothetical protein
MLEQFTNDLFMGIIHPKTSKSYYIPLTYKITNMKYTILYILIYILFGIFGILCLRLLRVHNEIDLKNLLGITKLPIHIGILSIIYVILVVINIIFIWKIVNKFFFKEFKKLHIYLHQFGGSLDKDSDYNKNLHYIMASYYSRDSRLILKYSLYRIRDILCLLLESSLICWDDIPVTLQPVARLFWISKYKNFKLLKFIIYILKEMHNGFLTFIRILPYIILLTVIIFDLYTYQGILKHFYQTLLYIYIYRTWHNLALFYQQRCEYSDRYLCIYYYKKDDLLNKDLIKKHYLYYKRLTDNFIGSLTDQNNKDLYLYVYYDLNIHLVSINHHYKDPYEHASNIGKWFVKQRTHIYETKFIQYIFSKLQDILNKLRENK